MCVYIYIHTYKNIRRGYMYVPMADVTVERIWACIYTYSIYIFIHHPLRYIHVYRSRYKYKYSYRFLCAPAAAEEVAGETVCVCIHICILIHVDTWTYTNIDVGIYI